MCACLATMRSPYPLPVIVKLLSPRRERFPSLWVVTYMNLINKIRKMLGRIVFLRARTGCAVNIMTGLPLTACIMPDQLGFKGSRFFCCWQDQRCHGIVYPYRLRAIELYYGFHILREIIMIEWSCRIMQSCHTYGRHGHFAQGSVFIGEKKVDASR